MPRAAVRSNAGRAAEHGCGQPKKPRRIFANCQQHLQSRATVQRAGREFLVALVCAECVHSLRQSRRGICHHLCSLASSPCGVRSNRGHQGATADFQPRQQGTVDTYLINMLLSFPQCHAVANYTFRCPEYCSVDLFKRFNVCIQVIIIQPQIPSNCKSSPASQTDSPVKEPSPDPSTPAKKQEDPEVYAQLVLTVSTGSGPHYS